MERLDQDSAQDGRLNGGISATALNNYRVGAVVAVSDMELARDFYENRLGLTARGDDPDGGRTDECGEQTTLHVFPAPPDAGKSDATVAAGT